jgi:hypothetical protein
MKSANCLLWTAPIPLLTLAVLVSLLTGCCSSKPKQPATHSRGWIGGEYKTVSAFPPSLKHTQKSALLVTGLNTNTPAAAAGLAEGDLVLELDHQPATSLKKFRQTIDVTEPGKLLALKAWHDNQILECNVRVGRETFNYNGTFAVGFPAFFHEVRLWPTSGFSLCVLGYEPEPLDDRKDLSSAEQRYFISCSPTNYHATDEGWKAWLVIMQASTSKTINSQEIVAPETASALNPAGDKGLSFLSR